MFFLGALVVFGVAISLWEGRCGKRNPIKRRIAALTGVLLFSGVTLIVVSAYQLWLTHRQLPTSTQQTLFSGVTYIRDVRQQPAPLIIYIVKIDLNDLGIHFLVTPGQLSDDKQLPARTTSQFLNEFHVQVAINGDFFTPWHSNSIFDYYPHVGDYVNATGYASSRGGVYSKGAEGHPTLYISKNNQMSFDKPSAEIYNAISGNVIFVQEGKSTIDNLTDPYHTERQPRTAVGLTRDGKTLLLIVVDGRQPNYSEGATMKELSSIAIQHGAFTALNLDGGGSTTLAMEDSSGFPLVLNSPIDGYIPGRERPVANHLGVFASKRSLF